MPFSTILALPFFFISALAAPPFTNAIFPRGLSSVGQTGATQAAEQICFLGHCLDLGKDLGDHGPKGDKAHSHCNLMQCVTAPGSTFATCASHQLNPTATAWTTAYCATGILKLGGDMPLPCKDCIGKLKLFSGGR
ncbi:hypothetical protein EG328_008817 [Venturia inaequalis]|uniref:Uncharacterized protein n=1 Tax=Venturia inaequalis TaxID=5025 RepID=A0A8H3UBM8_VENIN|nr:hypothetical protein EG328_008817 [Venturia inaequalis]KAE9969797.1 hypothetical protein EG327_010481 [Venturia inaequalis]